MSTIGSREREELGTFGSRTRKRLGAAKRYLWLADAGETGYEVGGPVYSLGERLWGLELTSFPQQ